MRVTRLVSAGTTRSWLTDDTVTVGTVLLGSTVEETVNEPAYCLVSLSTALLRSALVSRFSMTGTACSGNCVLYEAEPVVGGDCTLRVTEEWYGRCPLAARPMNAAIATMVMTTTSAQYRRRTLHSCSGSTRPTPRCSSAGRVPLRRAGGTPRACPAGTSLVGQRAVPCEETTRRQSYGLTGRPNMPCPRRARAEPPAVPSLRCSRQHHA